MAMFGVNKGDYLGYCFILQRTLSCFPQSIPATIHYPTLFFLTYIRAYPPVLPGVVGFKKPHSIPLGLLLCVYSNRHYIQTALLPLAYLTAIGFFVRSERISHHESRGRRKASPILLSRTSSLDHPFTSALYSSLYTTVYCDIMVAL